MKGQRLFVRETTAGDVEALRAFHRSEESDEPSDLADDGVVARLVGDLVAHLTWRVEGNQATITHVYVMKALRRKRIGRALLLDTVAIARAKNLERLVVSGSCPARDFFLRTGFAVAGDELVLEVS